MSQDDDELADFLFSLFFKAIGASIAGLIGFFAIAHARRDTQEILGEAEWKPNRAPPNGLLIAAFVVLGLPAMCSGFSYLGSPSLGGPQSDYLIAALLLLGPPAAALAIHNRPRGQTTRSKVQRAPSVPPPADSMQASLIAQEEEVLNAPSGEEAKEEMRKWYDLGQVLDAGSFARHHESSYPPVITVGYVPEKYHGPFEFGEDSVPHADIKAKDLSNHIVCLGRSGSGKSKLLQSVFLQRFLSLPGGVCLIDPNGDLAEWILESLLGGIYNHGPDEEGGYFETEDAYHRLAYIEFGGDQHVPFNVLADSKQNPSYAANKIADAFARVWPELATAATFRNTFIPLATVLAYNELPLVCVLRLIDDEAFREKCMRAVPDTYLRQAIAQLFPEEGKKSSAQVVSTRNRISELLLSPTLRYALGQEANVLNMRHLMDQGRSVIVNLGRVREDNTRNLLSALLLSSIEQAALSRVDTPEDQRSPWLVMVDEWPAVAGRDVTAITNMLEQARKFGVGLMLAGQSVSQVAGKGVLGAIGNAKSLITMQVDAASARMLAQTVNLDGEVTRWASLIQQLPPRCGFLKADSIPLPFNTLSITQPPEHLLYEMGAVRQRYYETYHVTEPAARADLEVMLAGDPFTGTPPPVTPEEREAGFNVDDLWQPIEDPEVGTDAEAPPAH